MRQVLTERLVQQVPQGLREQGTVEQDIQVLLERQGRKVQPVRTVQQEPTVQPARMAQQEQMAQRERTVQPVRMG